MLIVGQWQELNPFAPDFRKVSVNGQREQKDRLKPEQKLLQYTWVPDYCFEIAFVYKLWTYLFRSQYYLVLGGSGTQPDLRLIGHSAQPGLFWASQPGTCPSKPQEQQLSETHKQLKRHCSIFVSIYKHVCMATHAAKPCLRMCMSAISPDYVAGLGEAACHKEAFDDVDFFIHGLRQMGGNWDSQKKSGKRQNVKRPRSPASTNFMFSTKCKIKKEPAATVME